MSDAVAPSVLEGVLSDEFDDFQVEVVDGESIIVTDSFAAGFYHPDELDAFEQSLQEYLLQYTQLWEVGDVSGNHLEGYYRAVLVQETDSS